MNIDSSWGYGKTFFLRRWQKDLEQNNHLVLNFNAWENDYSKDPLLTFLSEIGSQLVQKLDSDDAGGEAPANALRWDKFKRSTSALIRTYGPGIAKKAVIAAVTAALGGVPIPLSGSQETSDDSVNSVGNSDDSALRVSESSIQKALDAVSDYETQDIFKEQTARKKAVEDFKMSLKAVVQSVKDHVATDDKKYELPVFIFVDELDRCRPDFTIELMEVVKHIFNVDDVFFVFATDSNQLQASLEGTYGSRFDAELYFKRIFSREMHLRRPNNEQFARALIAEYGILDDPTSLHWLINITAHRDELAAFVSDFEWVADAFDLTLRDQHQLAASFDSIFRFRIYQKQKTCTAITLSLLVLWQKKKQLFKDLSNRPEKYKKFENWLGQFDEHFPLHDRHASRVTSLFPIDFGSENVTLLTTLAVFAELLTLNQSDIKTKFEMNFFKYDFESKIYSDLRTPGGGPVPDHDRPLMRYFDQIMMAG
jgi:hypothetical protein